MKKIYKIISIFILITFSFWNYSYANLDFVTEEWIKVIDEKTERVKREEVLTFMWDLMDEVATPYNYIQVKYKDVKKWSKLEDAMKKFIYLDRFPNLNINLEINSDVDAFEFYALAKQLLKLNINPTSDALKWNIVTRDDFVYIRNSYYHVWEFQEIEKENIVIKQSNLWEKWLILEDVLNIIMNNHYDKSELDQDELIYSAIQWLAWATWDKHTAYFPPTKTQSFLDWLAWEFEWIWAYVDMPSPWVLRIVNPVQWSPAEKVWLKWWDIVIKVWDKEVTDKVSIDEVTSWIKWPEWTEVELTILRNETEELIIKVKREKILINSIELEEIDRNTIYIQITWFNIWVSDELKKVLEDIKNNSYKKIIFDLRNNWGWYLDEVLKILSNLVPEWEKTAEIRYIQATKPYYSTGEQVIDLSKYDVYILQNTGTASASEIFIWTIKDYFENVVTIWEKTFGKGSMQEVQQYVDGSMLKVTTAKWFTWWTETGIDWVWINPDVEIELDLEQYAEGIDNQLEEAIKK